jgi:hypothetical protein
MNQIGLVLEKAVGFEPIAFLVIVSSCAYLVICEGNSA